MKFFQSIRWRMQLWHGLLLVLVLAGFGYTAWRLQRATAMHQVDQDLERRIAVVANAMRRGDDRPDREPPDRDRPPPRDRQSPADPPPPPPEVRLSPRDESLFDGDSGGGFYFVAWHPDGRELSRSANAPASMPYPERRQDPAYARSRASFREYVRFMPPGECILVGRDIHGELAAIRRFNWILTGAGGMVLLLGLGGGWWVSARTLRPLAEISTTAAKISTGDLSQRIHTADTSSELGALAGVLNDTFGRLQASFARQAQFTADASHELRTPVTVILTQTQIALARERTTEEYRDSLAACQRAAQRMRKLTESLLMLARLDSGDAAATCEPCELDRIANDATDLLLPIAMQNQVTIETHLLPTRCNGNPEQLAQVVTNLVSNAITHNRSGGNVNVNVTTEPDAAVLIVTDTGPGIPPDDIPHIFERFYRSDKSRSSTAGGAGLGLAITKAIVDAHHGSIHVTTDANHGSSFTVRLPRLN